MSQKKEIYHDSVKLKIKVVQYVRSQVQIWRNVQSLMIIEAGFSKRTLMSEEFLLLSEIPYACVNLQTGELSGHYNRPISIETALFLAANREKIDARNHAARLRFIIKAWESRNKAKVSP